MNFSGLTIGILKEIMLGERRVAAIPETIKKMVLNGAEVIVEQGAGEGAFFRDEKYIEAGAKIADSPDKIFELCDIILKVKEPQFNLTLGKHEADMFRDGQYLFCFLHPASPANHDAVKRLAATGVCSLTLDSMPRMLRTQNMDALSSMSLVAGYKAVLNAANMLNKMLPMMGTPVGMIKPASVVVIGTGVAGLQAIATAKRFGAVVTGVDILPEAVEKARAFGARVFETGTPFDLAVGESGAVKRLPEEWLAKERLKLKELVKTADILILSALIQGKKAPILVDESMVMAMTAGSVIVDISIDQGGNCELTVPEKTVERFGVFIDGTRNIPGTIPTSSTFMFAHNMYNLLEYITEDGRVMLDDNDIITKSILTTKDHEIVHAGTREAMNLETI